MRFFTRAGGFAAAMMLVAAGMFHPTPSRAWERDVPAAPPAVMPVSPALDTLPESSPAPTAAVPDADATAPRRENRASLESLVAENEAAATRDEEHECLASAVYFEAKGEPLRGQLGVAQVILNRAGSGRFPASLCGVVKQRGQFSFVRGGRLPVVPRASSAWRKAVAIARIARDGLAADAIAEASAGRALFFHARRVAPQWHGLTRVASIGNQVFFR
jgi:spore germination cell wall hydrolase CwlJ-like protein